LNRALLRNLLLLASCQALLLTNAVTIVAITGLVGTKIAPHISLATVPLTTYVIGTAASTMPASLFMRRHGRRKGFLLGGALAVLGALVCTIAVWNSQFLLLCVGTAMFGIYNAFGLYYRFAAADIAPKEMRSRAISWTLAGGIVGGVLGPETSKLTRGLFEPLFAGSYLVLAVFAVLSMLLISRISLPHAAVEEGESSGRPLREIARQPVFIVAAIGALVGYGIMNLLMNATSIAMNLCGLSYENTAFVLQWHVIGMYAPSFVTGSLIARFGVLRIMSAGCVTMLACISIALAGVALTNFWWALFLLGVGWNFLFVGGTTLLTEAYAPSEKAKTQGLNDLLVFCTTAMTSLASGALVTSAGWATLNYVAIPLLLVCVAALIWLARARRPIRSPET
jgi:MFS family permease